MAKKRNQIPVDLALLIVEELGKRPRPAPDETADDDWVFDYQHGRPRGVPDDVERGRASAR